MNLCLSQKVLNIGTCKEDEADDEFSFFSPDGTVRCDSNLQVTPEGKVTVKETPESLQDSDESVSDSLSKRSLENAPPRDEIEQTIEYQGLVKRPKTPLITACDIAKQAAAICERKASACGSLPDVVSSSTLENNEMSGSRQSLAVDSHQSDYDYKQSENKHNSVNDELPLPDILTNDEEIAAVETIPNFSVVSQIEFPKPPSPLPPILIEDHEPWIEASVDTNTKSPLPIVSSPCPEEAQRNKTNVVSERLTVQCNDTNSDGEEEMSISPVSHLSDDLVTEEPAVMSPGPVIKNYTVEEGFERPCGGWGDSGPGKSVTEVLEEDC